MFNVQNEVYTWRVLEKSGLSSVSKISWETLSVTSRRGAPTSRRQNYISLPRRDVKFTSLCHVATWMYTSRSHFLPLSATSRRQLVQVSITSRRGPARRDVVWSCALSRRDMTPNVATWSCFLSVTSRRHPARRDVTLFLAQEWFILALHLTHPHSSKP